jgi:hypothetical protein
MIRKISVSDVNSSLEIIAKDFETINEHFRQIQPHFTKVRVGKQEAIITLNMEGELSFKYAIEINAKKITPKELNLIKILLYGLDEQIATGENELQKLILIREANNKEESLLAQNLRLELQVKLLGLYEITSELLKIKEAK